VALAFDPASLAVEELDVAVTNLRDGQPARVLAQELGRVTVFRDCVEEPEQRCWFGVPWYILFRESEPGTVLVDIRITPPGDSPRVDDYPGEAPIEILRLRARILEGSRSSEVAIRGSKVTYPEMSFELEAVSGAWLQIPESDTFAPATEVLSGIVTVEGRGFRRGDPTADGKLELTDAVVTLLYLFQGGPEPPCRDAADSDDNGSIEITDGIVLLSRLFMGGPLLPAPHPDCGADGTRDELGCKVGCEVR
jgi:hypothetical protein